MRDIILFVLSSCVSGVFFRDTADPRQQVTPRNIPLLCLGLCDVCGFTVMDPLNQ